MSASGKYAAWISAYVAAHNNFVRGLCKEATREMVAAFPELRLAAGFAHCRWGADQHWWCVDPDGVIVDPTAAQFGELGPFEYEELDLNSPATLDRIPVGKCMNCGEPTFRFSPSTRACSTRCEDELADYYRIPQVSP